MIARRMRVGGGRREKLEAGWTWGGGGGEVAGGGAGGGGVVGAPQMVGLLELLGDPAKAETVGSFDVPRLLGDLEALRARLWARLLASPTPQPEVHLAERPDRLLTAAQAAGLLGVADRWM